MYISCHLNICYGTSGVFKGPVNLVLTTAAVTKASVGRIFRYEKGCCFCTQTDEQMRVFNAILQFSTIVEMRWLDFRLQKSEGIFPFKIILKVFKDCFDR